MKISVIMVDGGFRERIFGAEYFSNQDFAEGEYEMIWVDYYDRLHPGLAALPKVRTITLDRSGEYHSSYCFNYGIAESRGEVIVIPDADQIVQSDFLSRVWELHRRYDRLAVYGYRYDEPEAGALRTLAFKDLERTCVMKMPTNFGACLTVRRQWLLEINGYEQHEIFASGFHANGKDIAIRFKNLGLAIQWEPGLRLYHPFHPMTATHSAAYEQQLKVIEWRRRTLQYTAFSGIDEQRNVPPPADLVEFLDAEKPSRAGRTRAIGDRMRRLFARA
jgi:hypothetical protein